MPAIHSIRPASAERRRRAQGFSRGYTQGYTQGFTQGYTRGFTRGFTLLELLAVLAILGLIAAFAAPQVFKWLGGAKSDSARIQIENLGSAIDLYRLEVGTYPPDLGALIEKPSGADKWDGPYLKKKVIPKDPWSNDYVYRLPGQNGPYDLYSLGADRAEGGDGEARDIVSWE